MRRRRLANRTNGGESVPESGQTRQAYFQVESDAGGGAPRSQPGESEWPPRCTARDRDCRRSSGRATEDRDRSTLATRDPIEFQSLRFQVDWTSPNFPSLLKERVADR